MRYDGTMVRNEQMPEMGKFAVEAANAVRKRVQDAGLTQMQVAARLSRAQSYVSVRWNGRKAWTLNELDVIAQLVGAEDALDLIRSK